MQQIESLSVLGQLLSQQEVHLQYLDERHARSQTPSDRTVSRTNPHGGPSDVVSEHGVTGRAVDELQLFVQKQNS